MLSVTPAERDEIVHVLNRITFGPRPGDVEAVQKMGLHNYIEQQLHPESINDSAVEQEVAGFQLLQMSPEELTQMFQGERKKALAKQKALAAANGPTQTPPAALTAVAGDNPDPESNRAAPHAGCGWR